MVSFSQRVHILVGLMSLATKAGLVGEDRLGLGALPSLTYPGSPSLGSQAEQHAGGADTAVGPIQLWGLCGQSGVCGGGRWLSCHHDCYCPVCPSRAVTVSGEAWPLSWGQDGTSDSSHSHSLIINSTSDHGLWLLEAPQGWEAG